MSSSVSNAWSQFTQYATNMNEQTWLLICAGGMVVGYLALRGFGSRSNY